MGPSIWPSFIEIGEMACITTAWSSHGHALNYTEVFDGIWSAEADENTEVGCGGREEKAESCTDSESDDNVSLSFSESSEEIEDSDSDDQESLHSGDENDSSPQKTFSAQECACMAILSLISRHCITTEAAKDIMASLKNVISDMFKKIEQKNLLTMFSHA